MENEKQIIKLLLVEDNDLDAEIIRRSFITYDGEKFSLTEAVTVGQAKKTIENEKFDLVVSDMMLPDGKGTEIIDSVKSKGESPIVVMTGHGDEQLAVEALRRGALDYVVKTTESLSDMPHVALRALREWGHIIEKRTAENKLKEKLTELEGAVEHIKKLEGLMPLCVNCKKIKLEKNGKTKDPDDNKWLTIEEYLSKKTNLNLKHTICPDCTGKVYGDMNCED